MTISGLANNNHFPGLFQAVGTLHHTLHYRLKRFEPITALLGKCSYHHVAVPNTFQESQPFKNLTKNLLSDDIARAKT